MTNGSGMDKSARAAESTSNAADSSSPAGASDTSATRLPQAPTSSTAKKTKTARSDKPSAPASSPNSLIICRNKHWRFISSFHGPWLQMPVEMLQVIANINYNTVRPRPVDPAVVFDILKVRRGVDEATAFAIGAANDLASSTLINVNGAVPYLNSLGHGAKLSKERKLRMRELACQRLARAYRLDEIACSVATMQGASALEDVGGLVLQRNRDDLDAKYVHFFHEKIPSRHLVESTDLQPLTDIIASGHGEAEALRTRATVKVFQEDLEGAIQDLTEALKHSRYRDKAAHDPGSAKLADGPQDAQQIRNGKKKPELVLPENDQPSGLGPQLLFQRALVHLTMACRHVEGSVRAPSTPRVPLGTGPASPSTTTASTAEAEAAGAAEEAETAEAAEAAEASEAAETAEADDAQASVPEEQLDCRKLVKLWAKRALKDYMSFLSCFEYSPNLPVKLLSEFNERVSLVANGIFRHPRISNAPAARPEHIVYSASELFSSVPPPHLPAYPLQPSATRGAKATTCEIVTYHPLLTDALHALLLCHCLVQTSAKEIQRHAYMVARLVRLCDGYPVFHASRSAARSDWVEVIRRTKNWLQLDSTWEALCAPVNMHDGDAICDHHKDASSAAAAASLFLLPRGGASSADDASLPSPSGAAGGGSGNTSTGGALVAPQPSVLKGGSEPCAVPWPAEDARDFPFLTDRAVPVSRWIREVPTVTGTTKRKKRSKRMGRKGDFVHVGGMQELAVSQS